MLARRVLLLAMSFVLTACPAAKVYKEGLSFEETSHEYEAAKRYLDALGINPDHKKSREALLGIAEEAYKEKLTEAERVEGARNFKDAVTEYTELDAFMNEVSDAGAGGFATIDFAAKIEEMGNQAAEERYLAAEGYLTSGLFDDAIDAYKAALAFKQNYKDSYEKIAAAYYGLGERFENGRQPRKAAENFRNAATAHTGGYKDAKARAAGLYLGLGKHFLGVDRCRQAVRDLRSAGELGADITTDLAAAQECAVTPVAVMPFENPTGINPSGLALGDAIADQVLANVTSTASEFVRIVDRTALSTILDEQGLSGGNPRGLRGVRFLVTGRVTQVLVEEPKVTPTAKTAEGRERYACVKTNSQGQSVQSECVRDILVHYVDHEGRSAVKLVASAKVIDVKTGEQVAAPTITAVLEDTVHYTDTFMVPGVGPTTPVAYNRAGGTEIEDDSLIALLGGRRELKDTNTLVAGATTKLATDLAAELVKAVDREVAAVDPETVATSQ